MSLKLSESILKIFKEDVCPICRKSGREDLISKFLIDFANSHRLRAYQGKVKKNVIIRKDAQGTESNTPVILQAHIDMVSVPSSYDFSRGIKPVETKLASGENVIVGYNPVNGKRTSLGADDGIGVAVILALLESKTLVHPPVIAIFTVEEETGMDGAAAITFVEIQSAAGDWDLLNASFINIDEEEDGVFSVGCAGGARVRVKLPFSRIAVPRDMVNYTIEVSGLKGGHSGIDIDKGRANAIVLLGRAMETLMKQFPSSMVLYKVDKRTDVANAIPQTASVSVGVLTNYSASFKAKAQELRIIFREEFKSAEEALELKAIEDAGVYSVCCPESSFKAFTAAVTEIQTGVIRKEGDQVITSNNIGIIEETTDGGNAFADIVCMVRSSADAEKEAEINKIKRRAEDIGAVVMLENNSPGWNYREVNALRDMFLATYKELFPDSSPKARCIHAGLECGHFVKLFDANLKGNKIDYIACGPTIKTVHTPDETLYVETVPHTAALLEEVLKKLAQK